MTPLHVAAERAHNDVMEVLHKHGAKVSLDSAQGGKQPSGLGSPRHHHFQKRQLAHAFVFKLIGCLLKLI